MTDDELRQAWPELRAVIVELRATGRSELAGRLVDAVRGGATSGEILGRVGLALRGQHEVRASLGVVARRGWDAVMADVHRACPGSALSDWLAGLADRLRRGPAGRG